jgi:hypothetical protein
LVSQFSVSDFTNHTRRIIKQLRMNNNAACGYKFKL